ncbi:MAG: S1 family peptidase [Nocardioides sp.]|nr:S1 family peptidase [Nocardioides sp.]
MAEQTAGVSGLDRGQCLINHDSGVGEADHCTITAVGRDAEDRLVTLSAAHCARDSVSGELIELWVDEQKVGQFVSAERTVPGLPGSLQPGYYDFAFAVLDESRVEIASERGADVSAGLPAEDAKVGTFTKVCKSGMTTGPDLWPLHRNRGTTPREHIVAVHMRPGDSGGPLYTEDGHPLRIASRILPNYFGDVRDALAYALSKGWVGGGFEPIA